MTTEGLLLQPDGDDRWLIVEAQRPGSDGVIAVAAGPSGEVRVSPGPSGGDAPPEGPYAGAEEALEAVGQWRLARWSADV